MRIAGALCGVIAALACRPGEAKRAAASLDSSLLSERAVRFDRAVAQPDSGGSPDEPVARWLLPQSLAEISGLAIAPDGGLLAHGDEQARVTALDYRRGTVRKQFLVGSPTVRGDLEGIAVAGSVVYLLASNGKLYEFREGANGSRVTYRVHDTRLGRECEFEGVAYEAATSSLLLACKNIGKQGAREDHLLIYRWKLAGSGRERLSQLKVPLGSVLAANGWKGLHPTDIAVDPSNGNYVLVAAPERALIELTPQGTVVSARRLPARHTQPEGVAITRDGILIIADEGSQNQASITLYRRR